MSESEIIKVYQEGIQSVSYNILTIPTLEEGVILCQNLKSSKFIRKGFNPL